MSLPHVTVVGAGQVGATTTHLLALQGLANVTLVDIVEGLAEGKALDLMQAAPMEGFAGWVRGSTAYASLAGSRLVIVTAGLARKPGMTREDLLAANARIVGPIAEQVAAHAPQAILLIVTNPLDLMVALALKRSGLPRTRVMGMAGVLDSARLRAFIGERLQVPSSTVQAMVLGSHGELMVPIVSSITVGGKPVTSVLSAQELEALFQRTRDGGAEIVRYLKTGSAFYAPASGVVEMAGAILRDTHATLPACAALEGEYGLRDVCLGVPVQLGAKGIERIVDMPLAPAERQALTAAAAQVREGIARLSAAVAASPTPAP